MRYAPVGAVRVRGELVLPVSPAPGRCEGASLSEEAPRGWAWTPAALLRPRTWRKQGGHAHSAGERETVGGLGRGGPQAGPWAPGPQRVSATSFAPRSLRKPVSRHLLALRSLGLCAAFVHRARLRECTLASGHPPPAPPPALSRAHLWALFARPVARCSSLWTQAARADRAPTLGCDARQDTLASHTPSRPAALPRDACVRHTPMNKDV